MRFTHAGSVIGGPAAYGRVELMDQDTLRQGFTASDDPPKLGKMGRDVGLGGFDQGFIPQALAVAAFA